MSLSNDKEPLLKVHLVEGETWMMKNSREKSEEKTDFMSVLVENWWSLCVLSPSPPKLYEIVVVNDWTTTFSFYMVDLDMLLPISYFLCAFFLCAFFLFCCCCCCYCCCWENCALLDSGHIVCLVFFFFFLFLFLFLFMLSWARAMILLSLSLSLSLSLFFFFFPLN